MSFGYGALIHKIKENINVNDKIDQTFLARYVPLQIANSRFADFIDLYIPFSADHPVLRVRKFGNTFEITKKAAIDTTDVSHQHEVTIPLTQVEYDQLATVPGKRVVKRRYFLPVGEKMAEIDIFFEKLAGLVLVQFEFEDAVERDTFESPDFCLADVTQEEFVAGGYLAGRSFEEIKPYLNRFQYQPFSFPQ